MQFLYSIDPMTYNILSGKLSQKHLPVNHDSPHVSIPFTYLSLKTLKPSWKSLE